MASILSCAYWKIHRIPLSDGTISRPTNFYRSGEKDIHTFAESRRRNRRRTQIIQPAGLSAEAIPDTGSQP